MTDTFTLVSAYNQDIEWLKDYFSNYVIYDQGIGGNRPHFGGDILDKLSWIVENYDNLPDVVMFIKANLFNYITKEEFELLHDTKIFTPLLTQLHRTYLPVCFYKDGLFHEINNSWYAQQFPHEFFLKYEDFSKEMGLSNPEYLAFAPGANYIVPKENILKRPKAFYEKLMGYIDYTSYSAEIQMIERSLYTIWA